MQLKDPVLPSPLISRELDVDGIVEREKTSSILKAGLKDLCLQIE